MPVLWSRAQALRILLLLGIIAALLLIDLYGPSRHGDVNLYHRYAVTFWGASPPLQQLPEEYPPLSILAFSLTMLPSIPEYALVFGLWMATLFVAAYFVIGRLYSRRTALLFASYLVIGGAATLLSRYDLVPALTALAAMVAAARGRFTTAYLLVGAGVLLKLYPIVLLPVVMLEHRRVLRERGETSLLPTRVVAGALQSAAVVAAGFLAAYLLTGPGALSTFRYATGRPLQVESVPASLLWLLSLLGHHVSADHSFGSFNLIGDLSGYVSTASSLALVAGCLVVYWRQAQGTLPVGRAFLAATCVVLATSKVFSPQFMIWVAPLVAVVEGLDIAWIAVFALTFMIYPIAYLMEGLHPPLPPSYSFGFLALIALRNALFVGATWRVLKGGTPAGRPAPAMVAVRR